MSTPTSRYPAAEGTAGVVTTWLPLTTVYPNVPSCKTELYSPNNLTHIYAYDPNQNALTFATKCWPSEARSWWNQDTSAAAITSLGPFLCPEAYTVAVTTVVNSGSTLSGCCPSGYALWSLMSQPYPGECTSTITSGATITYVSSWTPAADGYTTITAVLDSDHAVQAVQINGYNFDGNSAVPTVTAFSSSTSSSSTSASASKSETAASSSTPSSSGAAATSTLAVSSSSTIDSSNSSSGVGTGAKIGIAVGIAVGVVAIAALIGTIFFMRRRKRYDTAPQQDSPYAASQIKMNQVASLPSSPGSDIPHEIGNGYGYEAHEVGNTQVHEMNGSTFAELDGNNRR
ncbi:uncharacterized protein Bfra_000638 [Botrytis fragariae]|uniref:Uncharacterized protein n=1 Tax=Botrytis fragariae TaxID=1964551 RepID=A0A8H6B3S7_9HELO|nr:uncharacterized protein Bfra_000638 [Botrytis fragariae]KAF5878472.1 hypothetical protein Bfra_000638 [Botrytis fragariae]